MTTNGEQPMVTDADGPSTPAVLVHLDLKGAPPRISYYEQLFPLLHDCGVTGLLIEYEDMFPYSDKLTSLACPNAYSFEEIALLQELAQKSNLEIIPLVQSFGHLQFALKHPEFAELREATGIHNALCATHPDAVSFVLLMVKQLIATHPNVLRLHLGGDEVAPLGCCQRCQEFKIGQKSSDYHLYLNHMQKISKEVKELYPQLRLIIWDDMLRTIPSKLLQESGLGDCVEPMLWHYEDQFCVPKDRIDAYAEVFPTFWAASAFKGASGIDQIVPHVPQHLQNHRTWVKTILDLRSAFTDGMSGIVLTGWSRYDHYAVLCETICAGIPSLILCLNTLHQGLGNNVAYQRTCQKLGVDEPFAGDSGPDLSNNLEFPGKEACCYTKEAMQLVHRTNLLVSSPSFRGWFTSSHIRFKSSCPNHTQFVCDESKSLLQQLEIVHQNLEKELGSVLYPNAVEELIAIIISPSVQKLTEINKQAEEVLQAIQARS